MSDAKALEGLMLAVTSRFSASERARASEYRRCAYLTGFCPGLLASFSGPALGESYGHLPTNFGETRGT